MKFFLSLFILGCLGAIEGFLFPAWIALPLSIMTGFVGMAVLSKLLDF